MVLPLLLKGAAMFPIVIKSIDVMIKSKNLIPKINKSSWITLNVGGKQFLTTKHTMVKTPSIFRQFIIDEPTEAIPIYKWRFWKKKYREYRNPPKLNMDLQAYYQIRQKSDNHFYIDRDPICFAVVLNFMRHGKLIYTKDVSITGIMEEASYFQVEELIDIIEDISGIKRADLPKATPLYLPDRYANEEEFSLRKVAAERMQEIEIEEEKLEAEKRAIAETLVAKIDKSNHNNNNNHENVQKKE